MRSILPVAAVLVALCASTPASATCTWLNEAYTLGPGVYAAGHGFNCDERGAYDKASADLARQRTYDFFAKHVG